MTPSLASVDVAGDARVPVVGLSGQVDLSNAAVLSAAMLEAVSNAARGLVIDLSSLEYMDSAAVNMLADIAERLRWREQRLAVIAPQGSRPRQVLELAGTADVVSVAETRDAALARVAEEPP